MTAMKRLMPMETEAAANFHRAHTTVTVINHEERKACRFNIVWREGRVVTS